MVTTNYKEGSRGETVKQIQRAIGATPDGVWGPATTLRIKEWQRTHGLTPDGIVGAMTLAKMGITMASSASFITNSSINKHISLSPGRPLKYIAIHYTKGTTSKRGTAMATRNVFLNRNASADFVVDDEQIVQINPNIRNYYCWAVGDKKNPYTGGGRLYGIATNRNTISIEICSTLRSGTSAAVPNHDGFAFTDSVLDNALRLVRYLMQQYGIPKQNVVRHYDITGKLCPGIVGWNDATIFFTDGESNYPKRNNSDKWLAFWNKI